MIKYPKLMFQDELRDDALLRLLKGERFSQCDSIIVYCTRRDECVRLATLIRTKLQVNWQETMTIHFTPCFNFI